MDERAFCDRDELGPPRTSVPTIKKITDGGSICDRNDLGRPMVAPTSEMDVVVFGYRPNKDLYLTLHNKKETRGSLLSACFFLALILNYRTSMSLWITISKTSLGNIGSSYEITLYHHPQKSFLLLFFKKEEKKPHHKLTSQ